MRICSIEGCNEKHEAKGYCKKHYRSYHKYGDPLYIENKEGKSKRQNTLYEENHTIIDEIEHKKCSICENWFPMNKDYFYKNEANSIDGLHPYCKECTKEKASKWEKSNPEKRKKAKKRYDEKLERRLSRRETSKKFREEGRQRQWYRENKEKLTVYRVKRKMNRKHDISKEEWMKCKEYFNNQCAYCGLPVEEHFVKFKDELIHNDLHKEHVNHKGSNKIDNCVPSCQSCNSSKWTYSIEEWYNNENPNYTKERLDKIYKWLSGDYK